MTGFRIKNNNLINFNNKISFKYDNKKINAYEGDTIASALLASGQKVIGRSFKYHRPRGINSCGLEEAGGLFNVGLGDKRIANVKAPVAEVHENMNVFSQNCWPSPKFDIGRINDFLSSFITAGFYYKTFMGPFKSPKFWMFCEHFIREAAGFGRASKKRDPSNYDFSNITCDVLIIGSGIAGITATEKLIKNGYSTVLVEQDFELGGELLSTGLSEDLEFRNKKVSKILSFGGKILKRSTAFGIYDNLVTGVIERVTDHLEDPSPFLPREIIHVIRPKKIILATGSIERGFAFPNNDLPGVMLGHAVAKYASRFGVGVGNNIILSTSNNHTYEDARILLNNRMNVTILDSRNQNFSIQDEIEKLGAEIFRGYVPTNSIGTKQLVGIEISKISADGMILNNKIQLGCEVLGVSGGYSPQVNLLSHRGVKPIWNKNIKAFLPGKTREEIYTIGSANGIFNHSQILENTEKVINYLSGSKNKTNFKNDIIFDKLDSLFEIKVPQEKGKSFVDLQHDVTTEDIRQSVNEGFKSVEHMKRYTTLGMATDQGRSGNVIGINILADALNSSIEKTGTTTFRPPFVPISIGAFAGRYVGNEWAPIRRTPIHHNHLRQNAIMTDAGDWKRPWYYPKRNEDINDAYVREAKETRNHVGLVDVSTLGKITIQGKDSSEFIDRLYINSFKNLPVGKAKYGIMLRDDGFVLDDGTTWRLSENEFFMTTTTAQAGTVMSFMEELLQTRWTKLDVHLTSVTDLWAGFSIAGPKSREVLSKIISNVNFSKDSFLPMDIKDGKINVKNEKINCRLARISFSGELAWEIYINSIHASAVWDFLSNEIKKTNGCLYGMEALGTLRIEKGHVTAAELDGRVTLEDAGFSKMASTKKNYIGSVLRHRPDMKDQNRPKLVGIFPKNKSNNFGAGSIICEENKINGFGIGWVTAVTHSVVFDHWIGLGFISGGYKKWEGKEVIIADPIRNKFVKALIVNPHMYDPKGIIQNG